LRTSLPASIQTWNSLGMAIILACAAVNCELSPATPSPIDPDRPLVTMAVSPGTVETARSSAPGTIGYLYQACPRLSNPSDTAVHLSKMEFTPSGPDGGVYATQGTVGGFSIPAGNFYAGCWGFSEFNVTHPTAVMYRLRFTYYMSDNPTLLSVEGTSTLTVIPSRF
jgi:hypothetical protein